MKPRGFTTIEVIVVMIVLVTCAGIAIPAYQKTRENGIESNGAVNLKTIWAAQKLYYSKYGGYAESLDDLYIDYPPDKNFSYYATNDNSLKCIGYAIRTPGQLYALIVNKRGLVKKVDVEASGLPAISADDFVDE